MTAVPSEPDRPPSASTDPTPTAPAPTNAAPTGPAPINPAPTYPAPTDPTPAVENSADSAPESAAAEVEEPGPLLRLLDQRVAFVLVGAFNTAVSFSVFTALDLWWHTWVQLELLIAQQVSVLGAFVLHRRFVFRVRGHVLRDFLRFQLVQLGSLGLNLVLITLLVNALGWNSLLSQGLVTVLLVVLSFFGHRDFSFRRTEQERAAGG